jgi:hypothetical protein
MAVVAAVESHGVVYGTELAMGWALRDLRAIPRFARNLPRSADSSIFTIANIRIY